MRCIGSTSKKWTLVRPCHSTLKIPADSNIAKCLVMDCLAMCTLWFWLRRPQISNNVWPSFWFKSSMISRRVRLASARKMAQSLFTSIFIGPSLLVACRFHCSSLLVACRFHCSSLLAACQVDARNWKRACGLRKDKPQYHRLAACLLP